MSPYDTLKQQNIFAQFGEENDDEDWEENDTEE